MTRPLVERAREHASTHPESRDLIEELIAALPPEPEPDTEGDPQ